MMCVQESEAVLASKKGAVTRCNTGGQGRVPARPCWRERQGCIKGRYEVDRTSCGTRGAAQACGCTLPAQPIRPERQT